MNAPPSIALALMAVELATIRNPGMRTMLPGMGDHPLPRDAPVDDQPSATREYYRILDRISAGKRP